MWLLGWSRHNSAQRCGFMPNGVVLCSTVWFYAQPCDFVLNSVVLCLTLWFYAQRCGFRLNRVVLCSTVRFYAQRCYFVLSCCKKDGERLKKYDQPMVKTQQYQTHANSLT